MPLAAVLLRGRLEDVARGHHRAVGQGFPRPGRGGRGVPAGAQNIPDHADPVSGEAAEKGATGEHEGARAKA